MAKTLVGTVASQLVHISGHTCSIKLMVDRGVEGLVSLFCVVVVVLIFTH